jgi:N-acetylglucosaminyl-diphospho-decaprenol L-rhamnosyltransferase
LKLARGEKILFLNPDTILPEDCLVKCLQFFKQQTNIGALGVRMIDGAGNFLPESKRGFPSFFTSFCKMTGLTRLFPASKIFARYYLGHLPENTSNEVDVLSGAYIMVEKKVLDQVGSFDEDYFMYAEDIDLSYRIQKAGYKNFYFADTCIIHFKGESVSKHSAGYIRNFYGTMIQFIQKHYSGVVKNLYVLLLKIFILFKTKLAGKVKATKIKIPAKIVVIGDEGSITLIKPVLQENFAQVDIIKNSSGAPAGSAVLLCGPTVSFTEMIMFMQQYHDQYQFYFYAEGSRAINGSADKNRPGYSITL